MKKIMDEEMIGRSIKRITYEILERNKGTEGLVLVGIKTRGEALAKRIGSLIEDIEGDKVDILSYNFAYWRDDVELDNVIKEDIHYDFSNKIVVLCDDVIYRGRTIRAAMDGILENGRASMIEVAVLIDRGHREIPIKADFVGKNVPTSESENIKVKFEEFDNEDSVYIV